MGPSLSRPKAWLTVTFLASASLARAEDDLIRLIDELEHGPVSVQNHAIERLKFIGASRAGPHLRRMLDSPEPDVRVRASAALAVVADAGSLTDLEHAIGDEDWEVRRNSADALRILRRRSSSRVLSARLRVEKHPLVRRACVRALGAIGGGGPALVNVAMHDVETESRLAALHEIAQQMDPKSAHAVRPLLSDATALVRFAAARSMAWCGDGAGLDFLSRELGSKDGDARRRAVTALSDCPKPRCVELLQRALDVADVAKPAAEALARRGDARGLEWLAKLAMGEAPEARWADRLLSELGYDPRRRAELIRGSP